MRKLLLITCLLLLPVAASAEFIPFGFWQGAAEIPGTWTNTYMSYRSLWHNYQSNSVTIAYDWGPADLDATNMPGASEPTATIIGTNALGVVDYGYTFDGVNDYQKMANSWGVSPGTNNVTISVWCKPISVDTNGDFIFHDYGTGGIVSWGLGIGSDTNFFALFRDDDGDAARPQGTTEVTPGTWYHVVATLSNTTARLYVNGSLEATTNNAALDNVYSAPAPNPAIGSLSDGAQFFFNGIIDNLYLYPGRVMSLIDITNEYAMTDHAGITGNGNMEDFSRNFSDFSTPTIGLNMRTVSEPEISDYSGNGNTATNINSAIRKNEGTNENGVICYSYYFNPTLTQYLSGNSAISEIQSMDSATITMWVNVTNFANNTALMCASDSGTLRDFVLLETENAVAGRLVLNVRQEGTTRIYGDTTDHYLASGTWHFVVLAIGAAGNNIFIDGERAVVNYTTGSSASTYCFNDITDIDNLSFASRFQNGAMDLYFVGGLSNIRIYPKTLQSWEIYQLYIWTKPSNDLEVYP